MTAFNAKDDLSTLCSVVSREPHFVRHISHMRQRLEDSSLGFVLGAGVSEQAGVPMWRKLISRLYEHYGAEKLPDSYKQDTYPATLTAQFIFNRFKASQTKEWEGVDSTRIVAVAIRNKWYQHIHDAVYSDIKNTTLEEICAKHPYITELGQLVFKSQFCLTLNFDDIVDRVAQRLPPTASRDRPTVIWQPPTADRPNSCVIYHVNGYLPQVVGARRSEQIILTEDSFASLLASPSPIQTEYVMRKVISNTLLVIGTSFDDPSLRNLFYASARRNPASFHYCLQHDAEITASNCNSYEREDRRNLNRDMYNIITYFVNKSEIASIIRLLSLNVEEFAQNIRILGKPRNETGMYRYYVVGSVSSGKSSLVTRLRSFKTHEEWPEPPLPEMFRDPKSLTDEEKERVDDWVLTQLVRKNNAMRSPDFGIHVMDRAPLDLFAFSEKQGENKNKAQSLGTRVGKSIEDGQLIMLTAGGRALVERQVRRGRGPEWLAESAYDESKLVRQAQQLRSIYGLADDATINTSELSADDVAAKVSRDILFGTYNAIDLEAIRKAFEEGRELAP